MTAPYACPHCGLPVAGTSYHEGAADCVAALRADNKRLADELHEVWLAFGGDKYWVPGMTVRQSIEKLIADLENYRAAFNKAASDFGRLYEGRTNPRPPNWKPSADDVKQMAIWRELYETMIGMR